MNTGRRTDNYLTPCVCVWVIIRAGRGGGGSQVHISTGTFFIVAGLEIRLMFWSDIARTQYKTLWSCMGNLIDHFNNLVGKCPMTSCYF